MNNTDFRRLVSDTPRRHNEPSATPSGFAKPGKPSSTFGARSRASVPMTPRAIAGSNYNADFRRQLAERNGEQDSAAKKKLRGAAAPKGSKLAAGYTDRAAGRGVQEGEDEKAARIKALEEQVKLGQLELEEFEKLRDQITEGDIASTHLVKGLDRQLLERIRRGEDVLSGTANEEPAMQKEEEKAENRMAEEEVDDAFASLEQQEMAPIVHETVVKKGEMAPPPPPVAGVKRTRNDILAELKASRKAAQVEAAAKAAELQLGSRFRKIADKKTSKEPRIEIDERGREVLITYDEYGRIKRKVKKVDITTEESKPTQAPLRHEKSNKPMGALLIPDKAMKPLGMDAPSLPSAPELPNNDDNDDDIFAGAGVAYNPLGDVPIDDSDSDSDVEDTEPNATTQPQRAERAASPSDSLPEGDSADSEDDIQPPPQPPSITETAALLSTTQKQNYFKDEPTTTAPRIAPSQDPILLGAIKRAAAIATAAEEKETAVQSTAAQRLMARDRDLDDLDMGFGSSRFGDEEDEEGGGKIKLSEWKGGNGAGNDDDDGEQKKGGGKGPRKRGNKKRKGDANNAEDVLRVMEKRKQIG